MTLDPFSDTEPAWIKTSLRIGAGWLVSVTMLAPCVSVRLGVVIWIWPACCALAVMVTGVAVTASGVAFLLQSFSGTA